MLRRATQIVWAALALILGCLSGAAAADAAGANVDFVRDVEPILALYCSGCHNADDPQSGLSLDTFAELQRGGDRGAPIVPGEPDKSLLIQVLSPDGDPAMPPEDNERPTAEEIALLRAWIEAGAPAPADEPGAGKMAPTVPRVKAADGVRDYVTSLALSPDGSRLAVGRYQRVELLDAKTEQPIAATTQLPGKITAIAFAPDGKTFVAASGIAGASGAAAICNAADGAVLKTLAGHGDILYDAAFSPDGRLLATCSYDRQIILWNAASGEQVRTLAGHNGAVFDLAFSPDGAVLASASADGTVKIWNVATGDRLDTLGQAEGAQHAVAISPDGQLIAAGGADRQLRLWSLESRDQPRINPLVASMTAHEDSVARLAFSPDGAALVTASEGGDVCQWDATPLARRKRFERQPDVVTGLAFAPDGASFVVALISGERESFETAAGAAPTATSTLAVESPPAPSDDAKAEKASEQEPNDAIAAANAIPAHAVVSGAISQPGDVDVFRFSAAAGQQFVVEVDAARSKSPLDSRIEVLDAQGAPVPRLVLQAVRESYFTFRGMNSTQVNDFRLHGWEAMELNQYLYANGEVVKLWMYPRGPDSGFLVYPGFGSTRHAQFGTTPIVHALNETCYIVEPHRPGEPLQSTGLPRFTLYYENDDASEQDAGADSRLLFTAPSAGDYLIRVADVRHQGGDDYRYQLKVRPPRPGFTVKLNAPDLAVSPGSGKEFTVIAKRRDGFDGKIAVDVAGLPPGFHSSTPLTIEAGQTTAVGLITADADAPAVTPEQAKSVVWTASASVAGRDVAKKPRPLGELKLAGPPPIFARLEPLAGERGPLAPIAGGLPLELDIRPGQTISVRLRVERRSADGVITFGKEFSGRNLPHGVFVDNIGLNGITLLEGETEREVFITAARWVQPQTRTFHLRSDGEGNQSTQAVTLRVVAGKDGGAPAVSKVAVASQRD